MVQLYDLALENMENTVHTLAGRVPPPQCIPYTHSFFFRYVEKSLHQALIQKLQEQLVALMPLAL
jgi:hypothetical protein